MRFCFFLTSITGERGNQENPESDVLQGPIGPPVYPGPVWPESKWGPSNFDQSGSGLGVGYGRKSGPFIYVEAAKLQESPSKDRRIFASSFIPSKTSLVPKTTADSFPETSSSGQISNANRPSNRPTGMVDKLRHTFRAGR